MTSFSLIRAVRDNLYRSMGKPSIVVLDGIKIAIDPAVVPRAISKAIARGDYELPERVAVKRMLRSGDAILEMGGGIGIVSITAAQITGPGRVHVFEPQPEACSLIERNATLNGVKIICRNSAVGTKSGKRSFFHSANIISSSFLDRRGTSKHAVDVVDVDVIAIDELMRTLQPNVLISDIEGAEIEVFDKFNFASIDVVIIEMHPHIVGAIAVEVLATKMREQGLKEVLTLRSGNTHVYSREREPARSSVFEKLPAS